MALVAASAAADVCSYSDIEAQAKRAELVQSLRELLAKSEGVPGVFEGNVLGSECGKNGPACHARLSEYAQMLKAPVALEEGRSKGYIDVPKDLLAPEFSELTQKFSDLPKAIAYIERINKGKPPEARYVAVPFVAESGVEGITEGMGYENRELFGRLMVYVPGDPERYVNFVAVEKGRVDPNGALGVSVVAVKREAEGDYRSYFYDRVRDRYGGTHKTDEGGAGCYGCHRNGPIPIAFANMDKSPFAKEIAFINSRMNAKLAPPRLENQALEGRHDWPRIGELKERDDALIDSCTKDIKGVAELQKQAKFGRPDGAYLEFRSKVKSGMQCANCHNGKDSGYLDGAVNLEGPFFRNHILKGFMPKNPKLPYSALERRAILKCLRDEFLGTKERAGTLEAWLTEIRCGDAPNQRSARALLRDPVPPKKPSSGVSGLLEKISGGNRGD